MADPTSSTNPLQLFKSMFSRLHGWLALATALVGPGDLVRPNILATLGLSSAIRPTFNILAVVFVLFAAIYLVVKWSRRKITKPALDSLLRGGKRYLALSLLSFFAYYPAAALVDNMIMKSIAPLLRPAAFFLLALFPATGLALLAAAFMLLALHAHFESGTP